MFDTFNDDSRYCNESVFFHFIDRILIISILVLSVVYFFLIFRTNINWDEFSYLSIIYDYKAGRLTIPLQSFHVHLFGWLTNIKGWEVEQIIAARIVQLIILFFCMGLLYTISRNLFSITGALLTVFLSLSFTDIIRHGFSFRFDVLCLFFFLLSLFLLLRHRIISAIMAGFFLAVSFLISIKTIFYIPTILAILIISIFSSKDRKQIIKICFVFVFCSICWLLILYSLHNYLLTNSLLKSPATVLKAQAIVAKAGSVNLWTGKFFPRSTVIIRSVLENTGTWFVILLGTSVSFTHLFSPKFRWRYSIILTFILPLGSLLFYRNAFPYFFVFIMPPALIISGVYSEILEHYKKIGRTNFAIILFLVPIITAALNSGKLIGYQLKDQIKSQRELITLVHRIFPEPVPYIDRTGMISSFPKIGFFMSTWGLEDYRKNNMPIMRTLLEKHQPKFLIANTPVLRINDDKWFGQNKSIYRLLNDDYNILKKNFIHHWGELYVPGKNFKNLSKGKKQIFEILIRGKYTVEADGVVMIDSRHFMPGEVLSLKKGQHIIEAIGAHSVVLRWGKHLYRPEKKPTDKLIYMGL